MDEIFDPYNTITVFVFIKITVNSETGVNVLNRFHETSVGLLGLCLFVATNVEILAECQIWPFYIVGKHNHQNLICYFCDLKEFDAFSLVTVWYTCDVNF